MAFWGLEPISTCLCQFLQNMSRKGMYCRSMHLDTGWWGTYLKARLTPSPTWFLGHSLLVFLSLRIRCSSRQRVSQPPLLECISSEIVFYSPLKGFIGLLEIFCCLSNFALSIVFFLKMTDTLSYAYWEYLCCCLAFYGCILAHSSVW